jgi:hypothetical protein
VRKVVDLVRGAEGRQLSLKTGPAGLYKLSPGKCCLLMLQNDLTYVGRHSGIRGFSLSRADGLQ